MKALLADIELDIQELKCVIEAMSRDSNKTLCSVAKRNILQMRSKLDALLEELNSSSFSEVPVQQIQEIMPIPEPIKERKIETPGKVEDKQPSISISEQLSTPEQKDKKQTKVEETVPSVTPTILAERIKPTTDLHRSLSLNDTFRFARELFDNDSERMSRVLQQVGEMASLDAALAFLTANIKTDTENEALLDLLEIIKKYFNK